MFTFLQQRYKICLTILFLFIFNKRIIRWLKTNLLQVPAANPELRNITLPLRKGTKLIKLSRGHVCYQYVRPTSSTTLKRPLVVLVHGFIGSHAYFETIANTLASKGRTVLRFDNYGRGHSNSDSTPETVGLFTGQLAELLFALGETEPIDLVGYSMGGGIAGQFAQIYPNKIRSLSLLSPATGDGDGCRYNPSVSSILLRSLLFSLRHMPKFCVDMINKIGVYVLSGGVPDTMWNNPNKKCVVDYQKWMAIRQKYEPALGQSIFSTLSHFPLFKGAKHLYGGLSSCQFPVYLGWGARDIGPGTHNGYACEAFVEMGGCFYRSNEEDRKATLSFGNGHDRGSTSGTSGSRLFNAVGRTFEWFNGSHVFAIEDGVIVAERLYHFWTTSKTRQLKWRNAKVKDVERMNDMIEEAYKLGDEFFVDYDRVADNEKYTRTSYDTILNAVLVSKGNQNMALANQEKEKEKDKNSNDDNVAHVDQGPSTFMVGEMNNEKGESVIHACVQVHACNVPNQAEISFLTVSKEVQGRGVAKESMNIAEIIAINSGYYKSIGIDVVSTKPWLSKFYEKQGYRMTGESSKWPVPQYLKENYENMFFHRQMKSITIEAQFGEDDLTLHSEISGSMSPRTENFYNDTSND